MRFKFFIPQIGKEADGEPKGCAGCGCKGLHVHQHVKKKVIDHKLEEVKAIRYKCKACGKTFRWYPEGVSRDHQGAAVKGMSTILYVLGLSYDSVSTFLNALGCGIGKTTAWRDVQAVGPKAEELRRRRRKLRGKVKVIGVDTTIYKVKGKRIVAGMVTDALKGEVLELEILDSENGEEIKGWIEELVAELGVEVMISDDADAYKEVAEELGLDHQVCISHVRKWVSRRTNQLLEKASGLEGGDPQKFIQDCERIKELVKELPAEGEEEMEGIHLSYTWGPPPGKGEKASPWYQMRMMSLRLWENWSRLRLFKEREWCDEEGTKWRLDGTNNVTEREIGRCGKIRYKTMRGYKSEDGWRNVNNVLAWLGAQKGWYDLGELIA